MGLLYAGLDEAGYGPLLGPLCVGRASFHLARWAPGDAAPDLWDLLDDAVCRSPRDAKARVPLADSKKLKLPNQTKTRHPLLHLERGVLALLGAAGARAGSDRRLFELLGVDLDDRPWYQGESLALPLGSDAARLGIDANVLARALARSGVRPLGLACRAVGEDRFNRIVRDAGTKAAATEAALVGHLRAIAEEIAGLDDGDEVRVVCDRQSGRTRYRALLEEAFGVGVDVLEESARASRYRLGGRTVVLFVPEAEQAHLPVAVASMIAKLVRELAMARFNRYWCGRVAELKPTAGYYKDARRWLEDVHHALSPAEREALVRIA